jgi:hypothetical protein
LRAGSSKLDRDDGIEQKQNDSSRHYAPGNQLSHANLLIFGKPFPLPEGKPEGNMVCQSKLPVMRCCIVDGNRAERKSDPGAE